MWTDEFIWASENFETFLESTKEFIKNTQNPVDYGPVQFATNWNMRASLWNLSYEPSTGSVRVISSLGTIVELFSVLDAYRFDLTIDQSGRPLVVFEQQEASYVWWYDPLIPGFTVTSLGANTRNPFCCLDLKDYESLSGADVLITYSIGRNQYYRAGSERYTVERQVPGIDLRGIGVVKAGVGKNLRYTIVTR